MASGAGSVSVAGASYVVRGDDPSLVAQAVRDLLTKLVGDEDHSMVVEEHGTAGGDDVDVGAVVDALTTPPFLTSRRVVVVRDAGRLDSAQAARLAQCLKDPIPGVILVLAGGGGTIPAALVKAATAGTGAALDTAVGTGRARTQWLTEHLRGAPVRLDARAAARLGEHLGSDVSRLRGILETLASAYGSGATIDVDRLEPFLGEAGSLAPWDLTDAVDAGDTAMAMAVLRRLIGAGSMHPLVVLAILHRHYQAMLRLDGSGVTSGEEAAALLGARSVYPAKKALEQGRRMGAGRIGRAVTLLGQADLDVRGRSALSADTVLEVLVARLSRLGSVSGSRPQPSRSRSSAGDRR
jgi:DNA polymerase III subunit delta